jgi:microcystin degradation protein MlrC
MVKRTLVGLRSNSPSTPEARPMKLVIAQMKHETNTYSPVPTPLARFAHGGGSRPRATRRSRAYRGTGSALGAFIELAEAAARRS